MSNDSDVNGAVVDNNIAPSNGVYHDNNNNIDPISAAAITAAIATGGIPSRRASEANEPVAGHHRNDSISERLNHSLEEIDWLNALEHRTGFQKVYIVIGTLFVLWILIVILFGAHAFANTVAFVYPAYMSFCSLENDNASDHSNWLMYWVVYSIFSMTEYWTDLCLSWLPWYSVFKISFLVWLFLPYTNGGEKVYRFFVRPFLMNREDYIDKTLDKAYDTAAQVISEIRDVSTDLFVKSAAAVFSIPGASQLSTYFTKKQQ